MVHDVTVKINPKLDTYFLHRLHEKFFGFYSFMPFLKSTTLANSFNNKDAISQILGPKYEILSLPWKTDLLALQALNWFVKYNLYHVDEKCHWKSEEIYLNILWTFP